MCEYVKNRKTAALSELVYTYLRICFHFWEVNKNECKTDPIKMLDPEMQL